MNGECAISNTYSDIKKGAQVVAKDSANRTIAIGQLTSESSDMYRTTCTFHFTVANVPAGQKIYGVEVTHRGVTDVTEKKLQKGVILSLGG